MRILIVIAAVIIESSTYLIKVPNLQENVSSGSKLETWVKIQSTVLSLFENVCEESNDPVISALAQEFDSTTSNENYTHPDVLVHLKNLQVGRGFLPKGEIFAEYNEEHLNELKIIYDVMFYAENIDTFVKAAAWARQNINCGLFIDAIYLAILKRSDLQNISIPAPYEVLPNYFIHKDVVLKASSLMAGNKLIQSDLLDYHEGNKYTIVVNYTSEFNDDNDDSKLAYFHEDIGLNTYYFFRKLLSVPWLSSEINITSRYKEYLYHAMKIAAARCNLERYSNGLPEIEVLDWNNLQSNSYNPALIYSNGNDFNHRTKSLVLSMDENIKFLQNIENDISTVVSSMKQSGNDKTQIINSLMEILLTDGKSYENVARKVLGKNVESSNGELSVLDHYMTTLRDPMFWKLNNKMVHLIDNALKILPTYSKNELWFPGVEIINVEVKKMVTSFDYFELDITDALKTESSNVAFQVKIKQPRLNHKPFTIKVDISSQVTQKGLMKIYLGPKMHPEELYLKKNLFMLIDTFEVNLKVGSNAITRTTEEIKTLSKDFMSLNTLRMQAQHALYGFNMSLPRKTESNLGFPNRLILPKGSPEGLPVQIFVFIAPFLQYDSRDVNANMKHNTAILSPGYPFDLDIENTQLFSLPNAIVKNAVISHKGDIKFGNYKESPEKSYSGGSQEPLSLSDYNTQRERFDPSSHFNYLQKKSSFNSPKNNQYGKNEDYSAKKSWPYNKRYQERQLNLTDIPTSNATENETTENSDFEVHKFIPEEADNVITDDNKQTDNLIKRPTIDQKMLKKYFPSVFNYFVPATYDNNNVEDEVFE